MKLIERIYSLGPWLTHPVRAIVACEPEEVPGLPGVEWHGVAAFTGQYRAHLVGVDIETANRILAIDASEQR